MYTCWCYFVKLRAFTTSIYLLLYITISRNPCDDHNPNGHIFVDSPSIRRRNSTWKVRGNYIDFERRIHVEIMTSIRRGYFDVDSTFKIDEISMSSPRGFFYVVSTSNRRNFCTRCFHFLTFSALGTYSKLFWYNAESL